MTVLDTFPSFHDLRAIIDLARSEDLGSGDVTSRLLIAEDAVAVGTLLLKEPGICCGLPMVQMICSAYDERLSVEQIPGFHLEIIEGRLCESRQTPLLRVRGPERSLLAAERVILNFLQRMSGVATQTARFVRRVDGTKARIYDTRKTIPGLRLLDKYAVRCGGGSNYRMGLYDGLLVKDNHLSGVPVRMLAEHLEAIVLRSRSEAPQRFIEVEVDNHDQLREVLKVDRIDAILLDNMDCPGMAAAVELRRQVLTTQPHRKQKVEFEASGGITLETVRPIALTGVERISVGALTHSVKALDIGLDVEPQ